MNNAIRAEKYEQCNKIGEGGFENECNKIAEGGFDPLTYEFFAQF